MSETESRRERRSRYRRVVRVVERNANRYQTMGITTHSVVGICVKSGEDADKVRSAIQAAVENGDIVSVTDWADRTRLYPADEGQLVSMLDEEASAESPDRQRVATINQALGRIRA